MKMSYLSRLIKVCGLGSALVSVAAPISASDLQIYAGPATAGQTTLMMMLDRSGSMGMVADDYANNSIVEDFQEFRNNDGTANYSLCSATGNEGRRKFSQITKVDSIFPDISYILNYCVIPPAGQQDIEENRRFDRLSRLKKGMFEMLNSTDPKLETVHVGLGYYSADDGVSGVIKVPAAPLGKVNSTQRRLLKQNIANMSAGWSTPTSHAYAEAAAYLLGTNTLVNYRNYTKQLLIEEWQNPTTKAYVAHRICDNADGTQCYGTWTAYVYNNSALSLELGNGYSYRSDITEGGWYKKYYTKPTTTQITLSDSGFNKSIATAKNGSNYISPLPQQSRMCDGQSIYILSDGQPNNSSDQRSQVIAAQALGDPNFTCDVEGENLTNSHTGAGWKCMGAFAKKLFSGNHVKQREIKTAFVGFGKEFRGDMNESLSLDTRNACRLGSTGEGDDCSYWEDKVAGLTKAESNFRNSEVGFGNGGFFQVESDEDVTNSVLQAINNANPGTIEPLTTGAWSIPRDDLNPNGVQPFGYVRVIKPNPGTDDVLWAGNLKRYHLVDGVLQTSESGGRNIFNISGEFNSNVRDMWSNNTDENDGGDVYLGGAYANIRMPNLNQPANIRNLYTNLALKDGVLTGNLTEKSALLKIPATTSSDEKSIEYIRAQFDEQPTLKELDNPLKRKLLNFLGFNIEILDQELPSADVLKTLTADGQWNSFGGISHSMPAQVTYAGSLNEDGVLQNDRNQALLFGTMDGALRLINAEDGSEYFSFIPVDILNDGWQSLALRRNSTHVNGAAHGTDAPWIVDTTYNFEESVGADNKKQTKIKADQVSIYGGLRMGGHSYYGLDITDPKSPKFKFRINPEMSDYSAMGQSWAKPVLGNIRYGGEIRRVLFISGGYDTCYEDPQFELNKNYLAVESKFDNAFKTRCSRRTHANGNAIYAIDATTGERLFWVSHQGADKNNAKMLHSIVSTVSTVDTDGDGLIDHLYAGDLGGNVFRVDLNNQSQTAADYLVRVVQLADLSIDKNGVAITSGNQPRFYEAPTLTLHRINGKKFMLVALASGDRSSPLDVAPLNDNRPNTVGDALTHREFNKVFGLIDTDVLKQNVHLEAAVLSDVVITQARLQENPQVYATEQGIDVLMKNLSPFTDQLSDQTQYGWYRSLSSNAEGVERANGSFRQPGGIKAYEELSAIKDTLIVSVYDPESSVLSDYDPCEVRVIGETQSQQYCLPFGVCIKNSGGTVTLDGSSEALTGWRPARESDKIGNEVVNLPRGKGILGNSFADKPGSEGNCGGLQLAGNIQGTGEWACIAQTKSMSWFAR